MGDNEGSSLRSPSASASLRPTVTLPPRFGGIGASPGPMTLVSNFFSENDPESESLSFFQILAGPMASPAAVPGHRPRFPAAEDRESRGGGGNVDFGFKESRPAGLMSTRSPMFTVPPCLSPPSLLDSFLTPAQGHFGMSHQQALAQVTPHVAQSHPQMPPSIPERNISSGISHADQRPQLSSLAVDKPFDDGYNWRKYGQKPVKGSEYPKSYYKCTHPNCPVKKKVERSFEGQVTEIIYKGQHNHQPQQSNQRAKDSGNLDGNSFDGFNWRKYGQKPVKGSEYPKHYYKCTHPNCPVKKKVERFSEGEVTQIIYKGQHKHQSQQSNKRAKDTGNSDGNCELGLEGQTGNSGAGDSEEVGDAETGVYERDEDEPEPKRRNTEVAVSDPASSHLTVTRSMIIVQTSNEVDLLDDGDRWCKFGQKVVKGNPYPRRKGSKLTSKLKLRGGLLQGCQKMSELEDYDPTSTGEFQMDVHDLHKSLTFGAVELKSSVDSDHFPRLNVTSGQEPVQKLSIEVFRSFMEEDIDCFQINQVTKYLPRTEGLHNDTGMVHMDSLIDVENEAINNVNDMIIVDADAINKRDDASIVEDDARSNGDGVFIVQERNLVASDSEKVGHITISQREYKKTETSISYEVLELHFGMKLKDAAEKLGVSRSKLKRLCRQNGILRWPSHKRIEVNQLISDQDPRSSEPSPDQTLQDGRTTSIKATYGDDTINEGDDMIIEEDDAISNKDGTIIVEDVAINNGDNAVIVEKRNTVATHLKKKGNIKISDREHTKTETLISYEVLERHFEMKLKEAAKKLGVSPSKLKRLCRQNGIPRWPSQKRNEANYPISDQDPPSSELSPDQTLQDGRIATRKVTYGDDIINNGDDMIVVEDAISNGDDAIIVEDDTINNGDYPVIVEKRKTVTTHSRKEGNLKTAEREHKKTEASISYKVLEQHFGMKLEDAAKKLGVGRFKLKHLCRENGIPRWPSYKRNEVNHPLSVPDPPSSEPSPEQTLRNGRTATIKATYGDDIIKFQLSLSARMADLEEEVGKRLKLIFGNFRIKYTDEDGDLILIACDADLANCMRISLSMGMTSIKMVVLPLTS